MIDTLAWMLVAATLVPAHRAANQQSRRILIALVTIELVAIAMMLLASTSEHTWITLAQEDGSVEWATVAAFLMAAGYLVVVVRKLSPSRWFKGACFVLALFCVLVAGEEISWGQRLLGFKPPDVFLERNFQQELNLHNVLMDERGLGFELESKHLVMSIVVGFGLLWPVIVAHGRYRVFAPLAPPIALAPVALAIVAAQLSYAVELTGEGAEMIAGVLFLASAILATDMRPQRVVAWLVTPLIAGTLISLVMSRIVFGADDEGHQVAAAELSLLQADVTKGATAKLISKNIHKRLFTATRDEYVHLAGGTFLDGRGTPAEPDPQPRTDRHGYFLDPWNNPYWIYFEKKSKTGAIYSFGPNRRRDVRVRDAASNPGDDIVVRFSLSEDAPH